MAYLSYNEHNIVLDARTPAAITVITNDGTNHSPLQETNLFSVHHVTDLMLDMPQILKSSYLAAQMLRN